jgi:CheY-like chemotaxis protein
MTGPGDAPAGGGRPAGGDRPVVGIVEDQQAIAEMLLEVLRASRLEPVVFRPPYPVADITGAGTRVLLLDIMLDQASGWDTLEALRADPAGRDLPVVITSAVYARPGLRALPPGGPVVFIPKPFEMAALLSGIRDLLAAPPTPDRD